MVIPLVLGASDTSVSVDSVSVDSVSVDSVSPVVSCASVSVVISVLSVASDVSSDALGDTSDELSSRCVSDSVSVVISVIRSLIPSEVSSEVSSEDSEGEEVDFAAVSDAWSSGDLSQATKIEDIIIATNINAMIFFIEACPFLYIMDYFNLRSERTG